MKIKKFLLSVLSALVLILELLPNGVILRFANPEGDPWIRTYSYFSLTPFGYANFGPFITAVLTCVLILLVFFGWFKYSKSLKVAITCISGIAAATSLMPLLLGIDYFSTIGAVITVLLAVIFVCGFLEFKISQEVK